MFLLTIMLKQDKMEGWDVKPTGIGNYQNSGGPSVVLMCFPLPHVALSMIPLINHDLFDKMYIAPALLAHRPAGDSFIENLLFPSFSIPVSFCTA